MGFVPVGPDLVSMIMEAKRMGHNLSLFAAGVIFDAALGVEEDSTP